MSSVPGSKCPSLRGKQRGKQQLSAEGKEERGKKEGEEERRMRRQNVCDAHSCPLLPPLLWPAVSRVPRMLPDLPVVSEEHDGAKGAVWVNSLPVTGPHFTHSSGQRGHPKDILVSFPKDTRNGL